MTSDDTAWDGPLRAVRWLVAYHGLEIDDYRRRGRHQHLHPDMEWRRNAADSAAWVGQYTAYSETGYWDPQWVMRPRMRGALTRGRPERKHARW
jgi:hypothetical protein